MNYNNGVRRPMRTRSFIVLILFFAIFSAIMIGSGIIVKSIVKEMEGEINVDTSKYDKTVTATIIENEKGTMYMEDDSGGYESDTFSPIYQYEYNGQTYTSKGDVSNTTAHYSVGDKAEVIISSDNPSDMYDPNYNAGTEYKEFKGAVNAFWIMPIIIGIIIGVIMFFAIVKRILTPRHLKTF